jgi:hypothetical protein
MADIILIQNLDPDSIIQPESPNIHGISPDEGWPELP